VPTGDATIYSKVGVLLCTDFPLTTDGEAERFYETFRNRRPTFPNTDPLLRNSTPRYCFYAAAFFLPRFVTYAGRTKRTRRNNKRPADCSISFGTECFLTIRYPGVYTRIPCSTGTRVHIAGTRASAITAEIYDRAKPRRTDVTRCRPPFTRPPSRNASFSNARR